MAKLGIDPSRSEPSAELSGAVLIASDAAPTLATIGPLAVPCAICISTAGSSTSTRLYVTKDNGTTWIDITTGS